MRNDLHEPGRGRLTSTTKQTIAGAPGLPPAAVDAALEEVATPVVAQRGSRRELHAAGGRTESARVAIDDSHVAPGDVGLIRQLSRQLSLLEAQQQQIRRLLELTERRFAAR